MVRALSQGLKIPVFCKIRVLPDREKTLALVRGIEDAGCSLLTVHGRTKEQNKHTVGAADWDIIKTVKQTVRIPVYSNGGIHKWEDVVRCLEHTGCDGVMSAESLLENPALFSGEVHDLDQLAQEYFDLWKKYDNGNLKYLKPHLFKILHKGLGEHVDLRDKLAKIQGADEIEKVIKELAERRKDVRKEDKFGWYERYQSYKPMQHEVGKKKAKETGEKTDNPTTDGPNTHANHQHASTENGHCYDEHGDCMPPEKKLKTE